MRFQTHPCCTLLCRVHYALLSLSLSVFPDLFKAHYYIVAILQRSKKELMRDRVSPLPHHCWTYWVFVLCFGCSHISGSPIHSYILAIGLLSVSSALCSLCSPFMVQIWINLVLCFCCRVLKSPAVSDMVSSSAQIITFPGSSLMF